jgi:hypothetical protein
MTCPNCGSSRVRRAKRNIAEKIFLTMLVTRPFRCEDCIARFFGWIWSRAANSAAPCIDARSLVYTSPAAALHTDLKPRGKRRRRVYAPAPEPQFQAHAKPATQNKRPHFKRPHFSPATVASWLSKPIHHTKPARVVQEAPPVRRSAASANTEFFPEIIGVIAEVKH